MTRFFFFPIDCDALNHNSFLIVEVLMATNLTMRFPADWENECIASWWLNHTIWKICSSNWIIPQVGLKMKKIVWNHHLDYYCPVKLATKTPESWWLVQMNFLLGPFAYFQGRDVKLQGSNEPHVFVVWWWFTMVIQSQKSPSLSILTPRRPGYFVDPTPAMQVQTLPLEGPMILRVQQISIPLFSGGTETNPKCQKTPKKRRVRPTSNKKPGWNH